jgi:peptide/nickel transport system substrate-binding protein
MTGKPGKARVAFAVLGLTAVVAAACSSSKPSAGNAGNSSSNSTVAKPVRGGTLTVALDAESCGYVPGECMVSYSGSSVELALYDPLTTFNAQYQAVPFLATSVTADSTNTQWTVKLPANVHYVDGSVMVAQNLVDDLKQYYLSGTSAAFGTFAEVKSASAPDPTTVVFTLKAPDAQFPVLLTTFFPFNPDVKTKFGQDYGAHPDGTGPFELVSWVKNSQITLKANPNYWRKDSSGGQLPYLSQLDFKIIPVGSTRLATLQSGAVQVIESEEATILSQAQGMSSFQTVLPLGNGGYGLFFNTMAAPVSDVRLRMALAEATNNTAVVAAEGAGNLLQPRNQYYSPSSPWYSASAAAAYPSYNPTQAKQLLSQYVGDPTRSDHKAPGTPISLQINYIQGDSTSTAAVQVIQSEWKAIGVNVTLNAKDETTQITDAIKGNFTVNWFGWGDETPFQLFHHNYLPYPANLTNFTHFNSPAIEQQITSLATASDQAAVKADTQAIDQVLDQQVPLIFLMSFPAGWVVDPSKVINDILWPGGAELDSFRWDLISTK